MNIQELAIQQLTNGLSNKFDDLIIEGLKRKGFEFKNIREAESFIRENCRCEDYTHEQIRVYFVNDIPFILHEYKIEMPDIDFTNNGPKITASYGSYAYL